LGPRSSEALHLWHRNGPDPAFATTSSNVGRGFVDVDGFDPATSSKWDLIFWSKRVDAPSIAIVQFSVIFR
jgi:hypothetical protein